MNTLALKKKAFKLGATGFGISNVSGKRYYVIYNDKIINFGLNGGSTFIDHSDYSKRASWLARHKKITNDEGKYVYKLKTSPSYWSYNLLWN